MAGPGGYQADYLPDQERQLFYGKYRGIVAEVDAGTCRIKAKVPAVLGDVPSGWCMPCVPYAGRQTGIVFLPEIGTGVWIEFEGGDVSYPVWVGCYWRDGEVPDGAAANVKMIVTVAKHKLVLTDGEEPSIKVTDASENSVTLAKAGITISKGGQQIVIGQESVSVNDGALEVK